MNGAPQDEQRATVECRPTKDPAVRWLIFAAMAIALAIWCWTDRRSPPGKWDADHINEILNYLFNNWGPVVFAPLGLISLFVAIRQLTRKLVADDHGITYGSDVVEWSEVSKLDATELQSKGILTLVHGEGSKLRLDSWKLQDFKELVAFVETKLADVERIEP